MLWTPTPKRVLQTTSGWDVDPSNSHGVVLPNSGTAHVMGAITEIIASTPYDCDGLMLSPTGSYFASNRSDGLVNIYIGAQDSEVVLIPSLLFGWRASGGIQIANYISIRIKKGSRISASYQTDDTTSTCDLAVLCLGEGYSDASGGGMISRYDAIGVNTGTSQGTAITSSQAAWSTWQNLGSTLSRDYSAMYVCMQGVSSGTSHNSTAYYFQIGINSSPIFQFFTSTSASEYMFTMHPNSTLFRKLKSGSQLQCRGRVPAAAANQALQIAVYGGY